MIMMMMVEIIYWNMNLIVVVVQKKKCFYFSFCNINNKILLLIKKKIKILQFHTFSLSCFSFIILLLSNYQIALKLDLPLSGKIFEKPNFFERKLNNNEIRMNLIKLYQNNVWKWEKVGQQKQQTKQKKRSTDEAKNNQRLLKH